MTRGAIVVAVCLGVLGIGTGASLQRRPRLIWNASASVPIGLYAVHPAGTLHLGELLVVQPPEPLATLLDARRYLPRGVSLLKHVAALPGQTVCRAGTGVSVDGVIIGAALDRDHLGRPLPVWRGCHTLVTGEIFLMNVRAAASLDGRYFGPLANSTIIGRADPVWLMPEPRR